MQQFKIAIIEIKNRITSFFKIVLFKYLAMINVRIVTFSAIIVILVLIMQIIHK